MFIKILLTLATLNFCQAFIYSSFWAPLFNPKILGYKVDVKFDPNAGKRDMPGYNKEYGYRGENLIAHLGNGKALQYSRKQDLDPNYNDVNFYYTYPGAYQEDV